MERRRRMRHLAWAVLLLGLALGVQGLAANQSVSASSAADGPYEGHTLVSVQSYGLDGKLLELNEESEVVWKYDPPNSRVFDAEQLDNGNFLVAVTTKLPPSECPENQLVLVPGHCIEAKVLELDYETKEVVWNYSWYDEKITHHEVHDVDRLENGNTAIVDMGNDRALVVNESGEIVWEWHAENHLGEGTAFREKYGGPPNPGGEADWTHVNDIDKLENGNFQLSIRNFDVVIEVAPETKNITNVVGAPGKTEVLDHQHNPYKLRGGTLLVADSENDRVVELNATTDEIVWQYGGRGLLHWPRDADRLPNGNTLIVDTFNNRVVEINQRGEVVWKYEGVMMPYTADRLSVPEEDHETVPGTELRSRYSGVSSLEGTLKQAEAYAAFVFPTWVKLPELLTLAGMVVCGLVFLLDLSLAVFRRE
ncbi:aryl-sulfate sulfotransferase [Halorussus gelatinilyticus]|uniref:Aryl-sulfate sulfotransferase n=1 Tax=Halorussus gelatinilyticus TaxID=2937524 RepID=A0A8U0IMC0_9EURY|nr:aryl-sulfate sulfotransferase [Halorussus gelatinilyticus]UPW01354.1 aryl-sulfate sulfotransferase [Halorussus gelatinilyticus]